MSRVVSRANQQELFVKECVRAYKYMAQDHQYPWCWACGRDEFAKPVDWFAPWLIERAHIVKHPRREDARAVVLLCSLCHKVSHGDKIRTSDRSPPYVPLEVSHLLWLKKHFDRRFFALTFLQSNAISKLPPKHKPPLDYLREYRRRHPECTLARAV